MKIITDFPNYRIHRDGTIESRYLPKSNIPTDTWREIKPVLDKSCGYYIVTLCHNGVRKNKRVHRLLMEAFVPNPLSKKHVNHIDGNKLNNDLSNLEWATPQENSTHAVKLGLFDAQALKLGVEVEQYTLDGVYVATYPSLHQAGRDTGIAWQNISKVCRGLRKSAGNFKWKYK